MQSISVKPKFDDPDLRKYAVLIPKAKYAHVEATYIYKEYWNKGSVPMEDSLIHIPSKRLSPFGDLYFFEQYSYIEARIDAFRKYHQHKDDGFALPPGIVVSGTPGSGKTHLLYVMLARLLAKGETCILWSEPSFYVFTEAGVYATENASLFNNKEIYHWVWGFIDADATNPPPYSLFRNSWLFLVQAASPQPKHTAWIKQRPRSVIFAMNPPSHKELVTVLSHRYPEIDEKMIMKTIQDYGCNMRTLDMVLTSSISIMAKIYSKIGSLTPDRIQDILVGAAEDVSHIVVMSICAHQPQPGTPEYLGEDTLFNTIAGRAVLDILLKEHGRKMLLAIGYLFHQLNGVTQAAPTAGRLWEASCHNQISKGGRFTILKMELSENGKSLVQGRTPISLDISPMTIEYFHAYHKYSTTREQGIYYTPYNPANPTFDSFLRVEGIGVGFQMTIMNRHSIKAKGMSHLFKRLQDSTERYFVFVVPQGRVFSCPMPTEAQHKKFKFFTMEVEVPGWSIERINAFFDAGIEADVEMEDVADDVDADDGDVDYLD